MRISAVMCLLSASLLSAAEPAGEIGPNDWPTWRGPLHSGVATDKDPPVHWSASQNVVWKVTVPGRGHSSPTIVGSQVVLQTADETQQTQSVIVFDRFTGKRLWQTQLNRGSFPGRINPKNTHASSTVAGDGTRFFAVVLHHDSIHVTALACNDGKVLWQQRIGPFVPDEYRNGYAASPLIYRGTLIVLAECDGGSYMVALERGSGKEVWRTPRPSRVSYSSPALGHVAGRDQLLISGCDQMAGFDPSSGKRLWAVDATTMATSGTMVWHKDLAFASGGFPQPGTVCVRADGSGEIVWKNLQQCYEQSMLIHDGFLYAMNDGGIVFCWRATDGKEMWKFRLRGPVSASPVLAAGKIYISNELGTTYVFQASSKKYIEVARNQLGDEAFATPSICGGQLFTRVAYFEGDQRREVLYCISERASTQLPAGTLSGFER